MTDRLIVRRGYFLICSTYNGTISIDWLIGVKHQLLQYFDYHDGMNKFYIVLN